MFCDLLFAGQRDDGSVPAPGKAPTGALGLPVQGLLLGQVLRASRRSAEFLSEALRLAFHCALAQHRHLYEHRDPAQEGLISIFHPEEDGFGNNPAYHTLVPGTANGIQDPFFNTCLTWSNESLLAVGSFLGEDILEVMHWHELTIHSMNDKLWDEEAGHYQAYDLEKGCSIRIQTLAGLLPLAAEIPTQEQAERMLRVLNDKRWGVSSGDFYCYPSCLPEAEFADFHTGWRGPVWLALNWMLHQGLLRYDFNQAATKVRSDSLRLIAEFGFHDAFRPHVHSLGHPGLGAPASPAAAALALHWLLK